MKTILDYGSGRMGALEVLRSLSPLVKKQRNTRGMDSVACEARAELAKDVASIYRNEVRARALTASGEPQVNPDFFMAPLEAATDADNLGTLAGTLVSMHFLDLFVYNLPLIAGGRIMTDLSAEPGELNQKTSTRKILVPSVVSYDNTLDTDGYPKGWNPASAAQTLDVDITLDELIGCPIPYSLSTLSSTQRDLFSEAAPAAAYACARYYTQKLFAACTAANFNSYAAVTAADAEGIVKVPIAYQTYGCGLIDFARSKVTEIGAAFDSNEVPDRNRTLLLNVPYYNKLSTDPSLVTFFAGQQAPEIVTDGVLPNISGFTPVKAPSFPGSNNRVGMALQKNGLLAKSRLPANLNSINPGAANGSVTQIVHAETGLAMLLVQWTDHKRGYSAWLPCAILGASPGDKRGGLVLTNQ